jgi:hypothetical protein
MPGLYSLLRSRDTTGLTKLDGYTISETIQEMIAAW